MFMVFLRSKFQRGVDLRADEPHHAQGMALVSAAWV
jgi:hypothetical protein